jgi:hypothetical protein
MKSIATALLLLFAFVGIAGAGTLFVADLDGTQELPPTGSLGTGHADLYLNHAENSIHIKLTASNLSATITGAHVHRGARGVNGPIAFSIGAFTNSIEVDWSNPTPSDVADLKAGNLYVNVHTTSLPGGEIRGQLGGTGSTSYEAFLDGLHEVPPTGSAAMGYADITVPGDHSYLHIELSVTNFTNTITGSHIHQGAVGVNGPIIFSIGSFTGSVRADFALTSAQMSLLQLGDYYVNVHSTIFPAGEIRGQINNNSAAEVGPAPVAGADLPKISGFPNPVSDRAFVHFRLPRAQAGEISVIDVTGRMVRTLATGVLNAGDTVVPWDGRDQGGLRVPSGTYFYRMSTGGKDLATRAIVLR